MFIDRSHKFLLSNLTPKKLSSFQKADQLKSFTTKTISKQSPRKQNFFFFSPKNLCLLRITLRVGNKIICKVTIEIIRGLNKRKSHSKSLIVSLLLSLFASQVGLFNIFFFPLYFSQRPYRRLKSFVLIYSCFWQKGVLRSFQIVLGFIALWQWSEDLIVICLERDT